MSSVGFTDPLAFLESQLAAHAFGKPVDQDAMEHAATLVVAAQLVRSGLSMDAVERMFQERDHSFRIALEPDEDDADSVSLVVEVEWHDDEDEQP